MLPQAKKCCLGTSSILRTYAEAKEMLFVFLQDERQLRKYYFLYSSCKMA